MVVRPILNYFIFLEDMLAEKVTVFLGKVN